MRVEFDGAAGRFGGGGVIAVEMPQDGEDVPGRGAGRLEQDGAFGEGEAFGDVRAPRLGEAGERGGERFEDFGLAGEKGVEAAEDLEGIAGAVLVEQGSAEAVEGGPLEGKRRMDWA